jgi:hypothetical protein
VYHLRTARQRARSLSRLDQTCVELTAAVTDEAHDRSRACGDRLAHEAANGSDLDVHFPALSEAWAELEAAEAHLAAIEREGDR